MSRPKVQEGHKRSYRNVIRLTREEQERINQSAEACGLPVYLLIRQRLLSGKYPEPRLAKLDVQVYLELRKIGVNINQLAKRVNSGKWAAGISATLERLLHQQEIIRHLVK
ncbi:plasmid mobilization relaxosome protein MobC [Mucilaginibacter terrenus]|uniref:Plasmid mobilization relaxosome protein MobC n=1 Tax=Mucilaginibacter terrenus TaxID=2482727 RepID=A0A3E2NT26_9SPHI|nr:plasmid mobilization relaxosome protein MobC [Mucilaginibacter terrenus]RFZ84175.1 plasmid mobilization relaxosome protein MobC [Mucilaginibacter terrenus]